jgi:hypothetical protein
MTEVHKRGFGRKDNQLDVYEGPCTLCAVAAAAARITTIT